MVIQEGHILHVDVTAINVVPKAPVWVTDAGVPDDQMAVCFVRLYTASGVTLFTAPCRAPEVKVCRGVDPNPVFEIVGSDATSAVEGGGVLCMG